MIEQIEWQMSIFDLDIWSGKMSPEPLVQTKERTSEQCLKKQQKWQKGMPAFLDLRAENGQTQAASWEMGGALLGEYTMRSFGEYPNEEKGSLLSQILEATPHPKYCLSAKACQGILRRAEKRGQKIAGNAGAGAEKTSGAISFQERAGKPGGGKGILIQNEHTGALSTLNNQPVCYGISSFDSNAMKSANPHSGIYEAETARTLDLNGGSPACNQGGMAVVCLEGNGSRPSHKGDGYAESETMYTLNSTERHAVYDARGNGQIAPTITGDHQNRITDYTAITYQETTGSLCASGYDKLGTQEALNDMYVVQKQHGFAMQAIGEYKDCESASSLKQRDYKDATDLVVAFTPDSIVKNTDEGVAYSMLSGDYKDPQCVAYGLDRAAFNQGENAKYSFSVDEEKVGTCVAKGPNGVFASVVRRLTPMECERLQGFPDGWTDIGEWVDSKGKKHKDSDSPRYKALGNSIALPFWTWMAGRMVRNLPGTPTMGSLFDGIGGFPFAFSGWGCEPVWASEIEGFPIAVTKRRFPDA